MSKRAIMCISTAVVLILAAACGFIIGNITRGQESGTENTQMTYEAGASYTDSQSDGLDGSDESQPDAVGGNNGSTEDSGQSGSYGDSTQDNSDDTNNAGNGSESTEAASVSARARPDSDDYEYIILPKDGSVVVFYSDGETVFFDSGIEVMSLPDETIDQLIKGITFEDEEELFGFLESYSS